MNSKNSFYQQQKNDQWKNLISPLKDNSEIHSRFNDFITAFYWNFRQKKKVANDAYPEVNFQGFKGFEEHHQRAGYCHFDASQETQTEYANGQETGKTVKTNIKLAIFINQWYLLDKLGMDKLFSSENSYMPVGFNELIETMAHELAHAYQQTVNNYEWGKVRSQCESTGDKNKYPELVAEHTSLTIEIKGMIESSTEYQGFKEWWNTGKQSSSENEKQDEPEKNQKSDNLKTKQRGKQKLENQLDELHQEEKATTRELEDKIKLEKELTNEVKNAEERNEFAELVFLFNEASNKDLNNLVNSYQKKIKTNPLYTTAKKSFAGNESWNKENAKNNQECLDNIYNGLIKWFGSQLARLEIACPKCKTKYVENPPRAIKEWELWKNKASLSSYCPRCNSQEERKLSCSDCGETLLKENNYFCYHIVKSWAWKSEKEKQEYQHKPASGQKALNDKLQGQNNPETKTPNSFNWWFVIIPVLLIIGGIIIWLSVNKNKKKEN